MPELYIIGSCDKQPIKIGVTTDTNVRLKSIQTCYHSRLSIVKKWKLPPESAYRIETLAHTILGRYRLEGEWFGCVHEIAIREIESIMVNTANGSDLSYYAKLPSIYLKPKATQLAARNSAMKKKERVNERAKGLTRAEWTDGSIRNPQLVEKYGASLNALKRYASDKGWGHDRQKAIWRAEIAQKSKKAKAA
jgi:hypothetical protein